VAHDHTERHLGESEAAPAHLNVKLAVDPSRFNPVNEKQKAKVEEPEPRRGEPGGGTRGGNPGGSHRVPTVSPNNPRPASASSGDSKTTAAVAAKVRTATPFG